MRKSILLSSVLMLVSSLAMAGGFGAGGPSNQYTNMEQGQLQEQVNFNDNYVVLDSTTNFNEAGQLKETKLVVRNNPSVVAPDLTTSNGTCHGSTSAGASGAGAGISFGTTWVDESCNLRYNATTMHEMGYKQVALRIMCQEPTVAKAAPEICGLEIANDSKINLAEGIVSNGFISY